MIIPEGYAEVSIFFVSSQLPNNAMTSFGVRNATNKTPGQISTAVTIAAGDNLLPVMPLNLSISGVRVKLGPNEDGPDVTVPLAAAGTGDATSLIPNAAVIVRKSTDLGGRKHRGRFYWPFVTEQMHLGGGELNAAFVADCSDAADQINGDLTGDDLPMALLHGNGLLPPDIITGFAAEVLMGTQRRRLRA